RTISTRLAYDLKIPEAVTSMILAHSRKGVDSRYQYAAYIDERRAAMEQWGDVIDPPNNVTPLRKSA
ncbi:MAG: site-specific integrase, partial [Xanthobacteraceae bacterium]